MSPHGQLPHPKNNILVPGFFFFFFFFSQFCDINKIGIFSPEIRKIGQIYTKEKLIIEKRKNLARPTKKKQKLGFT
jgi:hypothetical protein